MYGKVYGVALGPGDPDLITIKALKCLQKVDKIYFPGSNTKEGNQVSFSWEILEQLELDETKLFMVNVPMSKNRLQAEQAYADLGDDIAKDLANNKQVAVVSEGDISFYSTFSYLLADFEKRQIDFEMIPGVPAFILGGSVGKLPLVSQNEKLLVVPNVGHEDELKAYLEKGQTVVLMKISKIRDWIKEFIEQNKLNFFYGEYLGTQKEFTCKDIESLKKRKIPYFAILIFYKNN